MKDIAISMRLSAYYTSNVFKIDCHFWLAHDLEPYNGCICFYCISPLYWCVNKNHTEPCYSGLFHQDFEREKACEVLKLITVGPRI